MAGGAALTALVCGLSATATGTAVASDDTTVDGGYVETLGYDPVHNKGALWHIARVVGAHTAYQNGITGKGVGVALIDTGVTEAPGLDTGNVYHGPDLSFDSQDPELAHKDAYGHGTHLASLIAGRDAAGHPSTYLDKTRFNGIAPDANLVNVKVGASDGAVDVSQVIAAIDWVVEHRDDNGLNIRVLTLAYGTDSVQDWQIDPLAYAAEQAWKAGILVVVAGGNDGSDHMVLSNPASDPNLFAVGADDTMGTVDPKDDAVPAFASRGTDKRHVDLVAPGVSVLGLRVPNGYADERNEQARVGARFAKASGTSQSAAVMSGVAALLFQAQPRLTPDQVKGHLSSTGRGLGDFPTKFRGKGLVDAGAAVTKKSGTFKPMGMWSTGTGSLEASRGSSHVYDGVAELRGEVDIFGNVWDGSYWARTSADGTAWQGSQWRGATWTGDGWNGRTWRDATWASNTWSGRTWRDDQWAGRTWRDNTWTGGDWTGRTWREAVWSGRTWRTADLASAGWLGRTWG